MKNMRYTIDMLIRSSEVENLTDINIDILRQFFEKGRNGSFGKPWGVSNYHNHYKHLKKFLRWSVQEGYIESNPIEKIGKPKRKKSLPRRLS